MRHRISLITHLPLQPSGGGVYAVSWHVHQQLLRHFDLLPVPVIATPIDRRGQLFSRLNRRVLRRPGDFFGFSRRVLDQVADAVSHSVPQVADAIFFRSATRWIHWKPDRPYFVHTDVCFHTFFHNTFQPAEFRTADLERIWQAEAQFLDGASAVFFESGWGFEKAKRAYGLSGRNFIQSRNAGGLQPPPADLRTRDDRFRLITIAKHFEQKGGDIVAAAWRSLKPRYPQLEWHIIGGQPDAATLSLPDVHCEGFLRADQPQELQRFRDLLAQSDLLVHPTREDCNPLVLVEAASFGCPCITVNAFAIPELVEDNATGLLLPQSAEPSRVAEAIEQLIQNPTRLLTMRQAARERALRLFQWDQIGDEIAAVIHGVLG
jgi:glycosyltransferase involved in cell wall biosynthesis